MVINLVLLRHGKSIWNLEDKCTGWTDVDLSNRGIAEARDAGSILKEKGYLYKVDFTSVLKRAIRTLWLVLALITRLFDRELRDAAVAFIL
jgi:2,3-bisphosphoglycerate-dependent phosphoglycerate mutase